MQGPGQVTQGSHTHLLWVLQWLQQVQKDQEGAELQGCSFLRGQLRVLQLRWHTGSCWEAGHDGTAQTQIQELPSAFIFRILTEKLHYQMNFPKMESLFIKFLFHLLLLNLLGLVCLSVQKLTLNKYFLICQFVCAFLRVSGSRNCPVGDTPPCDPALLLPQGHDQDHRCWGMCVPKAVAPLSLLQSWAAPLESAGWEGKR